MEFDCYICGRTIYAQAKMNGCKMICDECREVIDLEEEQAHAAGTPKTS